MIPRLLLAATALLAAGCQTRQNPSQPAAAAPSPAPDGPIRFASVAAQAGIDFRLSNGGRTPLTILETSGGGAAFLDFDSDGWLDVLLAGPHRVGLYRSLRNGRFADVTRASGLASRHWMGCAAGDYDGDGRTDVFLSGYRCHALYRNLGGGRFADVTRAAGIEGLEWSMSAAFADVDLDGRLDLFVSQYLHFDPPRTPRLCQVGRVVSACGPEVYDPLSGRLFMNTGHGRFKAVPWKDTGKTWGVLVSRLTDARRPAIYLANDMMPGDLWVNRTGRRWENIGPSSGTAYDAQGHLQGGMAVDSGDYDRDGRLDLVVTTYFAQASSLYRNDADGLFTVTSGPTGFGPPTMPYVKFGTGFVDFDNDGWLDMLCASGHVRDNVRDFDASQSYAQPLQVFRNQSGRFAEVSLAAGAIASQRAVGRGVAFGDYNRDGRVDALVCDLEGPAILLENRSDSGHWLGVRLADSGANRHGLGALVRAPVGGVELVREVRTNGGVLAAHEPAAWFGLGAQSGQIRLKVEWPDGRTTSATVPGPDRIVTLTPSGHTKKSEVRG